MEPLVAPGDVVMIRPVTPAELTPNTVVLYDRPDTGRVLHRILEQLPDGTFRTDQINSTTRPATVTGSLTVNGVQFIGHVTSSQMFDNRNSVTDIAR